MYVEALFVLYSLVFPYLRRLLSLNFRASSVSLMSMHLTYSESTVPSSAKLPSQYTVEKPFSENSQDTKINTSLHRVSICVESQFFVASSGGV
ncbi:hypothetical protein BX600DRAFT_137662 [Xylariales sp. PMI_506]|nr:hypothetical protein BX600DRAFT_137662 [Xylariales sp. PMI_506]